MKDLIPRLVTGSFLAVAAIICLVLFPPIATSLALGAALGYVLAYEWPRFGFWNLTPIYPVIPYLLLILLNQTCERWELLWLCLVVSGHDTGAYFAGNWFGATKLWPAVSPGKSWEGVCGGIIISLCLSWLFIYFFARLSFLGQLPWYSYTGLVILLNIAAVAGDLFESWLKRSAGLKDSGSLLPGHGGVLDRFDSILFAGSLWTIIRMWLR